MLDGTKSAILKVRDGLENLVSGLGTSLDKRSHSRFVNDVVTDSELLNMYRSDWAAAKIVDIIPDDCTRRWREFDGDKMLSPEDIALLDNEERRLRIRESFRAAHKWARLYGSSIIVMNVSGSGPLSSPLDITASGIKLRHIKAFDKTKVTPSIDIIDDPMSEQWGLPMFYTIHGTTEKIHHSRVIRFDGVNLPYDEMRRRNYWSDSVLQKIYGAIINLNTVSDHAAGLVFESNVDVIKVPNLMSQMASKSSEEALMKRFQLAKAMKSSSRILLMDSQEEYDIKKQSFAGLPELVDRYLAIVSAATDIPATRFLSTSAGGLNSTGEGDLKNYYDTVSAAQVNNYNIPLERIDRLIAVNVGINPADMLFSWRSLFQLTDKEESELENSRADRDSKYFDLGVIGAEEIAKDLKQRGTYMNIDVAEER